MKLNKIIEKVVEFFKKAYNYFSGRQFDEKPIMRIEYTHYEFDEFDLDIYTEINKIRIDLGLNELEILQDACDIANSHCEYLQLNSSDNFMINHDYFTQRADQIQLRYPGAIVGENVAGGYINALSVVSAWKKSPNHYINLSKSTYTHTGIAHIKGNGKCYVVQLFLKKY